MNTHSNPFDFTPAQKRLTLIGVMIVFLLSALDQTIVSTAMPVIVNELGGFELISWMFTAYMLASTVMIPIWGKLGDLYGRKPILIAGISLFLLGSWLSGLSGEFGDLPILGGGMTQLIAFRAVQGLGGGALFTTAFAIIADMFAPRERGKFAGLFGGVFGLASAIGPLIGGYFTDHGTLNIGDLTIAGWRWVFYLNVPLAIVSMFVIVFKMPKLSHAAKGKIDYLGALLVLAASIPFLLALTWGGGKYAWGSIPIVGLFGVAIVATILFVLAERRHSDPIIHLDLFSNKVFTWANTAGFFSSMAFLSVVAFLPLFMQLGQGVAATTSGLTTMPLMGGLIVSSIISGQVVSKTGRYKPPIMVGLVILFVGVFLLSRMGHHTTRLDLAWRMVILGIGLGPLQSTFNIAVQNAVPITRIGVVTGVNTFFRQIGSTVGVALFGTVLTNKLDSQLFAKFHVHLADLRKMQAPGTGHINMPEPAKVLISEAITSVFGLGLIVVALAILAAVMIPELPMRDLAAMRRAAAAEGEPTGDAHV